MATTHPLTPGVILGSMHLPTGMVGYAFYFPHLAGARMPF